MGNTSLSKWNTKNKQINRIFCSSFHHFPSTDKLIKRCKEAVEANLKPEVDFGCISTGLELAALIGIQGMIFITERYDLFQIHLCFLDRDASCSDLVYQVEKVTDQEFSVLRNLRTSSKTQALLNQRWFRVLRSKHHFFFCNRFIDLISISLLTSHCRIVVAKNCSNRIFGEGVRHNQKDKKKKQQKTNEQISKRRKRRKRR